MGATGRLPRSRVQDPPSSSDTHTPVSVPQYRSPRRAGSSRITRVNSLAGRPSLIRVQVRP